jgi:hypothetical protein
MGVPPFREVIKFSLNDWRPDPIKQRFREEISTQGSSPSKN